MIQTAFDEIIRKVFKNKVASCGYKQHKQIILDFLDNYLFPLLEKVYHGNKTNKFWQ